MGTPNIKKIMRCLGGIGITFAAAAQIFLPNKVLGNDSPKSEKNAFELSMPGFLRSRKKQLVNSSAPIDYRFKIMALAPEGERVKTGDILVKLAGVNLDEWEKSEKNQYDQQQVKLEREVRQTEEDIRILQDNVTQQETEFLILKISQGDRTKSVAPRADVPERTQAIWALDVEQKQQRLQIVKEKLLRKQTLLQVKRSILEKTLDDTRFMQNQYNNARTKSSKLATMDGVVLYNRSGWRAIKPKEGEIFSPGEHILSVVDDRDLFVEAYVREENWQKIAPDCKVNVKILGQRETSVSGKIEKIGKMVLPIGTWEQALPQGSSLKELRAFKVTIALSTVPTEAKPDGEVKISEIDCGNQKEHQ